MFLRIELLLPVLCREPALLFLLNECMLSALEATSVLSASEADPASVLSMAISTAAVMNVERSVNIAALTPSFAMINPAIPLPASVAVLAKTELRLTPVFMSSLLNTCALRALVAGR